MKDEAARARRRLSAQNGAARALVESDDLEQAIDGVLAAVCEGLGWAVGALWKPEAPGGPLRLGALWSDHAADVQAFIDASRAAEFPAGEGLPGRVFAEGTAAWIRDVAADPNFPRQGPALAVGLRGGFAVPVQHPTAPYGVLEFFTRETIEPDDELLETMAAVGSHLGQFIQRRRAEAALRESEEQFRTFAGTVPDATFIIDEASTIVYVNEAARRIFGWGPEELVGESLTRLIPERQRGLHRDGVRRFVETGERRITWDGVELPGLRRDGTEVPLEITFGTYVKDGRRYFTGIARDITDRLGAEEQVRFQARLLDAVAEAVIATDLEGRILYWNAHAERLYGWSAEEVMGRDVAEVTPTSMSRHQAEEIMDRLRRGEAWTGEFMARDRSSREFPVLVHDSPIEDVDGRLIGIIGTSTEITARIREEEGQRFLARAGAALASSLDYETTLRQVADLAVPTLGDWCFIHLLDDTGRLSGVARAQPDARSTDDGDVESVILEAGARFLMDVVRGEGPVIVDPRRTQETLDTARLRELDIVCLLAAPLRARDLPLGVLTFARRASSRAYDELDARHADELARRAALAIDNARLYEDAERGNRAKADFLAIVSHELRTPLNAITGYADLLLAGVGGALGAQQQQHVDRIKVGARHLAHLIDEILMFARVEAGRERLDLHDTDLVAVARECLVGAQRSAAAKDLALRFEGPDTPIRVQTDPSKVRQVLAHLLSNAVKYTEEGEVVVVVAREDDGARLGVRDTGIGIPRDDLQRVFEPFWQAEAPNTRTAGGTGLGLSVSQRIAEVLGGMLEVESRPGAGSEFRLILPARPPSALLED